MTERIKLESVPTRHAVEYQLRDSRGRFTAETECGINKGEIEGQSKKGSKRFNVEIIFPNHSGDRVLSGGTLVQDWGNVDEPIFEPA